jgi:hypothetical protein
LERGDARRYLWIIRRVSAKHADAPHPVGLLRACGQRPRRRAPE